MVGTFEGHKGNILCLGFQQDDKWMYSGAEDHCIKLWDLRTLSCQRDYKCSGAVNSIALHPNQGELISGDESGSIKLWDLTADQCVFTVQPDGKTPIRSVSISKNGKRLAVGTNKGDVFLYEVRREKFLQLKLLKKLEAHPQQAYILKCVISPNMKQLATASSDHSVKLWDLTADSLSLQKTLKGHRKWVWDCCYSTDSAYLITASSDMTCKLWDVQRGEAIKEYKGHQKAVVCVALNDV